MIFSFIKYINPGWQFNILPLSQVFPSYFSLESYNSIDIDERYETQSAKIADAGYRLWNKGVLLHSTQADNAKLRSLPQPTLTDEYIFIRKYGGIIWATYALILRLLTFRNPFKEIKYYLRTKSVKRENIFQSPVLFNDYEDFKSPLIQSNPLVAVIIPTLNRYDYLKKVLADLEKQHYKNFEVIIIDQSENYQESFYKPWKLNLTAINQKEKKLWTARNKAVLHTKASYLLFFDDDSSVKPDWIFEHLKCLDFFNSDVSAGISLATVGAKIPENYSYFRWADQFDSGNAMVRRHVFNEIGVFDEKFNGMRMGDGEFGFRVYKNGYKSISNPLASRIHYKATNGGLREMGSWDGFRPKKWFAPKPVPSVIYLFKKYLPNQFGSNAVFMGILLSNIPYKYKRSNAMLVVSILMSIIKAPVLFIQYKKSKKIALKMLSEQDIWLK